MMTRSQADCAIVGAGPSGLLLAVLLARAGWSVQVLERDPELGPPPGGVVLQPATLGLLDRLGKLGHLRCGGMTVDGVDETGPGGAVFSADYRQLPGAPVPWALAVPLRVLREALLDLARAEPGVVVRTGALVAGLADGPASGCAVELSTDAGTRMLRADYVVGADGKHSTVRRLARFAADVAPFASRQLIAKAPRPADWPQRIRSHRSERPVVVIPTGPGVVHVFGDVTVPEGAPAGHALAELAGAAGVCYPEVAGLLRARGECVALIRHHTVRVARWRSGHVVLLGDSAHSVHPYGGQGINLALQDAALLARALDEVLRGAGSPAPLDDFESRRRPFVERFQSRQRQLLGPGTAAETLYLADFAHLALGQEELRPLLQAEPALGEGSS
jgi:2-polyprenyl-6-methoxyphenol hydroxylase-like FAD-dependent oxidoreductase